MFLFGRKGRGGIGTGEPEQDAAVGGRIVTVWGPTGAPGRSTVAAALAGALASRGRVVLVDADLLRGAQEYLLGTEVGGNVAAASCFPPPRGAPCAPQQLFEHRAGFAVLPGVPGPAHPVPVEPEELAALLERLRRAFDLVVVDVGWSLPPHEHGLGHLAALTMADLVVVVAAATRLGLADLLLQYPVLGAKLGGPLCPSASVLADSADADLADSADAGPVVWCLLNNGHGHAMESAHRRITRDLGLPVAAYVPHDCAAVATAVERSLPLTLARRDSPASKVLWKVAERVWQVPARQRTERARSMRHGVDTEWAARSGRGACAECARRAQRDTEWTRSRGPYA